MSPNNHTKVKFWGLWTCIITWVRGEGLGLSLFFLPWFQRNPKEATIVKWNSFPNRYPNWAPLFFLKTYLEFTSSWSLHFSTYSDKEDDDTTPISIHIHFHPYYSFKRKAYTFFWVFFFIHNCLFVWWFLSFSYLAVCL